MSHRLSDVRYRSSWRPTHYTPYRSYSYLRLRPRTSVRDTLYRAPNLGTDTSWIRTDFDRDDWRSRSRVVPEVPKRELATKLHVKDVDLHIEENTKAHHTDNYECTEDQREDEFGKVKPAELVIRRGQSFKMTTTFDRPYDIKKNNITLVFTLGDDSDGKRVLTETLPLNEDKDASHKALQWSAKLEKQEEKSLTVSVFIPPSAAIGEWELSVRTIVDVEDGEDIVWQYNHSMDIIVLFNPWCKEDWVYLADDDIWLEESVMLDRGAIFHGRHKSIGALAWYFGQFQEGVLDAALHLVRKAFGFEVSKAMGNVTRIVRGLSKLVNSNDEAGVLVGRWGGDYAGGTSPIEWRGSPKILNKYMEKAAPVRYGQCWVFSGVLTTVCRALGIPCRSVTNFESAHNSDQDHLSCDVVNRQGFNGVWIEDKIDSVWNFHVWNEVWMARPDLNPGTGGVSYDGWQVIDATPQERSDGVFQCGPTPVSAVKEGDLHIGLDTAFVFAEVNGDKVEWREDPKTKTLIQLKRIKNAIGKKISTKYPRGGEDSSALILDVTDRYKYPEGSEKERASVKKAERMFRFANVDVEAGEMPAQIEVIEIQIEEPKKDTIAGFQVKVSLINAGDITRTANVNAEVVFTNYRGFETASAKHQQLPNCELKVGETKTITIDVEEETAISRPKDGFNFEVRAVAEVIESETIIKETANFRLKKPELNIEGPETCKKDETFEVKVSFTNPLTVRLTECKLLLDGNIKALGVHKDEIAIRDLAPGETWEKMLKVKPSAQPRFRKERGLDLTLSNVQLGTVYGSYEVTLE